MKNNLAYENNREIPDSPLLKNLTNKRTAGGVMIKTEKNTMSFIPAKNGATKSIMIYV